MDFLPHTLSFFGSVSEPLNGLDAQFLEQPQLDEEPLSKVLMRMMTLLSPEEQAERLENRDMLPQPSLIRGQAWDENSALPPLKPEERRLLSVFKQLVSDHRKSTRYYDAFSQLCQQYPDLEYLEHLRCSYLAEWGDTVLLRREVQALLERHPGWLFLRLLLARSYLHEDHPEPQGFLMAMQHKLLLEEHLPALESPLSDLLVYQFHLDLYLFFSLQRQLPRAAWCFNVCCHTVSEPEVMEPLAPFIMAGIESTDSDLDFAELLSFLKP